MESHATAQHNTTYARYCTFHTNAGSGPMLSIRHHHKITSTLKNVDADNLALPMELSLTNDEVQNEIGGTVDNKNSYTGQS
jgi:hypothetical protein